MISMISTIQFKGEQRQLQVKPQLAAKCTSGERRRMFCQRIGKQTHLHSFLRLGQNLENRAPLFQLDPISDKVHCPIFFLCSPFSQDLSKFCNGKIQVHLQNNLVMKLVTCNSISLPQNFKIFQLRYSNQSRTQVFLKYQQDTYTTVAQEPALRGMSFIQGC